MTNIAKFTRAGVPQHRNNWLILCSDTAYRKEDFRGRFSKEIGEHTYRKLGLLAIGHITLFRQHYPVWLEIAREQRRIGGDVVATAAPYRWFQP